jgi:hypothetical protein
MGSTLVGTTQTGKLESRVETAKSDKHISLLDFDFYYTDKMLKIQVLSSKCFFLTFENFKFQGQQSLRS